MKPSTFIIGTLTAAAVFSLATIATAADKGGPAPAQPQAVTIYKSPFAGAYIGAHAGYSQLTDESDFAGWNGGGHAGYAANINGLIIGAEIDATLSAANFTETAEEVSIRIANDWIMSLRGKLGYEVGNVMPYVTAGVAWARFTGSVNDGETVTRAGTTDQLWVIGGGIDYAVPATNLIVGLGILHYFDTSIDDGMTTARGSVSVKLN